MRARRSEERCAGQDATLTQNLSLSENAVGPFLEMGSEVQYHNYRRFHRDHGTALLVLNLLFDVMFIEGFDG